MVKVRAKVNILTHTEGGQWQIRSNVVLTRVNTGLGSPNSTKIYICMYSVDFIFDGLPELEKMF